MFASCSSQISFRETGYAEIGDLHLNIFRPEKAADLPVMVWIHGGGFYIGGASQFDPSALVAFENVLVVTINYRLGAHGPVSNIRVIARTHLGKLSK